MPDIGISGLLTHDQCGCLTRTIATRILIEISAMINTFVLKDFFSQEQLAELIHEFSFSDATVSELELAIREAFKDYIVSALSEMSGATEEHQKLYVEAIYPLERASKLLQGLPHPAGKMATRLLSMTETLKKLASGQQNIHSERASRFIEKNLIRRIKHVWDNNTKVSFFDYSGVDKGSPVRFVRRCLNAAGRSYPEIVWFASVDNARADNLIKSIRK